MKRLIWGILCVFPILAFCAVPVAQNGQPAAQIVLTADAGESGMLASQELQYWIQQISGAELPVVAKADSAIPRIVLKREPSLQLKADGYIISEPVEGKEIVIAAPKSRGLLSGVWKLLFINTDLIWARPNAEYGTIFTPKKTLIFDKTSFKYDPVFVLRGFQYVQYFEEEEMWQSRNGNNLSTHQVLNGKFQNALYDSGYCYIAYHNLVRIYMPEKKYWKTHPEYYALMKGKRVDPSLSPFKTNLCYTNKECQAEFLKNFQAIVKAHPQYDTFGICQEDNRDACECPECVKPIQLANGTVLTVKDKNFQSTRFFLWLTPIAEWLQKEYPGKKIKTNAYFLTEPAPGCKVPQNVMVSFAPIFKDGRYPITHPKNKEALAKFHSWTATGTNLRWREYYGLVGDFPRPADKVMAADLQYAAGKYGINETLSEMRHDRRVDNREMQLIWDQNSMYFYVMAHLHEDPYRPVEELRNEFLTRVYGEAAPYIREYYALIEKAWMQCPKKSQWNDNAQVIWKYCFMTDPSLKERLPELLAKAKACKMHPNGQKMLARLTANTNKHCNDKSLDISVKKANSKVDLSDPLFDTGAWQDASALEKFIPVIQNTKIIPHTKLKLLHDGSNLYVALRCTDPHGEKVYSPKAGSYRDQWLPGNKVEVFFTNGKGDRIQLVVDSNGNIFDALGKDTKWNQFHDIPVSRDAKGWSVLITVPLSLLGADQGKEEFRFYAARYYYDPEKKEKATLVFPVELSVWDTSVFPVLKLFPTPAEIVAEQKLPNLAKNGSFEKLTNQGTAAQNWTFWKTKDSKAQVSIETKGGINETNAAVLSGGGGTIYTQVRVQPGEKIYARVRAKRNGKGTSTVTLRFQTSKYQWLPLTFLSRKENFFANDDKWETVEVSAVVPKDAGFVVALLSGLSFPDGKVSYSNFELYKLPQPVKEQKNVNCAKNGSFEKLTKPGTAAQGWNFWKRNDSKAVLTFEKNAGVGGTNAAVISGGGGTLFSQIKTCPGEKFLVKVRAKKNGQGTCSFAVRYQTSKYKWLPSISTVSKKIDFPKDGEWVTVELTTVVPEDAGFIVPMMSGLSADEGKVSYSNFELYKLQ